MQEGKDTMCRIESPNLKKAESQDAVDRMATATNHLTSAYFQFLGYGISRRLGKTVTIVPTVAERVGFASELSRCVHLNSE